MNEIAPGLWHWTAQHHHISWEVSSYYLLSERVLIDPMIPAEGLDWFERNGAAEHVLLHLLDLALNGGDNVVVIFQIFKEVADVEESVAIEADIDEGRLHAGKHAGNTAFIDAAN